MKLHVYRIDSQIRLIRLHERKFCNTVIEHNACLVGISARMIFFSPLTDH
jgi:hypothetical protein